MENVDWITLTCKKAIELLPSLLSKLFKREVNVFREDLPKANDKGILPIYFFQFAQIITSKKLFKTEHFFGEF